MKRFIVLTVDQEPTVFGEKGSSARILVDADLIQLVKEDQGRTLIVLGAGLGEIEVKEPFEKLRRILCEEEKPERDLQKLVKALGEKPI